MTTASPERSEDLIEGGKISFYNVLRGKNEGLIVPKDKKQSCAS